MKLLFTALLLLCSLHSFSQKREMLQDSIPVKDSIFDKEASTIFHSILKSDDFVNTHLADTVKSIFGQVNTLDEVFIKPKSEFNAVTLGILKKEIIPPTISERQLYTAGDFKPIHLLSILGGSLAVDPIINAISGRTKRLKRYIQIEKKERNIIFLEDHFTEYMVENLAIEEQYIGRFLNYLVENETLQALIDRKDLGELHFLIGDEWFKFKSFQRDSTTETTENVDERKEISTKQASGEIETYPPKED